MRLYSEEDSPAKRGIVVVGALAASLSLLVLAATMLGGSRDPVPTANPRVSRPKASSRSAPAAAAVMVPAVAAPAGPREPKEVARDLDRSNARHLVRTLMEAAAADNANLKTAMLGTIVRYAASARPVIESELARAGHPAVRQALQEALAKVR